VSSLRTKSERVFRGIQFVLLVWALGGAVGCWLTSNRTMFVLNVSTTLFVVGMLTTHWVPLAFGTMLGSAFVFHEVLSEQNTALKLADVVAQGLLCFFVWLSYPGSMRMKRARVLVRPIWQLAPMSRAERWFGPDGLRQQWLKNGEDPRVVTLASGTVIDAMSKEERETFLQQRQWPGKREDDANNS